MDTHGPLCGAWVRCASAAALVACVRYLDVRGSSHLGSSVQHGVCVCVRGIWAPVPLRPPRRVSGRLQRLCAAASRQTVLGGGGATVVIWEGYLELCRKHLSLFVVSSVRGWFGGGLIRSADRSLSLLVRLFVVAWVWTLAGHGCSRSGSTLPAAVVGLGPSTAP